jgi:DNA-binding MarR family transcriptional regulator
LLIVAYATMSMKSTPYNLEDSLGYVIGRAGRALANRLNHNFASSGYDVTCEQWAVLTNLWLKNGQSQQDLAGTTCKDKTSMTRLVDTLEKKNLVVRIPGKEDKRQKLIYLTSKGRNLRNELFKVVQKTLEEAQKSINVKDLSICKSVLCKVYENLKI